MMADMSYEHMVLDAQSACSADKSLLGGKAYNLAWLTRNQYQVPPWIVLTTTSFEQQLAYCQLTDQVLNLDQLSPADQRKQCADIRQKLAQSTLAPHLAAKLKHSLAELPKGRLAVRSSAADEDSTTLSFAGQLDSFICLEDYPDIANAIINVMASGFGERAVRYRQQHQRSLSQTTLAVIVQTMVEGECSGVFFTAHPINGSRKQGLISACHGLAEGVVAGTADCDEFTVDLFSEEIKPQIHQKQFQIVYAQATGQGTERISVPEALQEKPCLSPQQIQLIKQQGFQIARQLGRPQDLEWTIAHDQLYWLQTRPITSLPAPEHPIGKRQIWDNSNIQESYCGITLPLTFTFALRAYQTVYQQTFQLLGVSKSKLRALQPALSNMLGLIQGRVYYNINHWYAALQILPGFKTNKADMERMMGLQDPVDFIEDQPDSWQQRLTRLPDSLHALSRLCWGFMTMDKRVRNFESHFENIYQQVNRAQLHTQSIAELMAQAEWLQRQLLDNWQTPIINDFMVMMTNGRLHRQLQALGINNAEALQNNLLSGETLASTEPTKHLMRLCDYIRNKPGLARLLTGLANDEVMPAIQYRYPEFYNRCQDYIEAFGDRCMGELKLESTTLRQDPRFLVALLKNYTANPNLNLSTLGKTERDLRTQAEATIRQQLMLQPLGKYRWRYQRIWKLLNLWRKSVKNRESMRLARTRAIGLIRDIYREIGQQLAFYGVIAEPDDIFYLTVTELEQYMQGTAIQTHWQSLVTTRKAEYDEYQQQDLPHHFQTVGPVYLHNEFSANTLSRFDEAMPYDTCTSSNTQPLKGIGCYPGIVTAPIKKIFSPNDDLDLQGHILCTVRTDPGWAPLFPTAAGILVERGSTLSHSAVVARELGIPAIVNIPGLTQQLETGQWVTMDGTTGNIQLQQTPVTTKQTPAELNSQSEVTEQKTNKAVLEETVV
ncbi:PEP/pyruvate-binding domain-containing protein [Zooshikella sp. RANM57]|uniref:PEP/pyruvate-binding domain-containing protein n=1 Tax=Zooshikella sp. RANM57 TaxID=3425863 RepID=UPI003D6E98B6